MYVLLKAIGCESIKRSVSDMRGIRQQKRTKSATAPWGVVFDGAKYETVEECAESQGINAGAIYHALRGKGSADWCGHKLEKWQPQQESRLNYDCCCPDCGSEEGWNGQMCVDCGYDGGRLAHKRRIDPVKSAFYAGFRSARRNVTAADGWDDDVIEESTLRYVLDDISRLDYELQSCVRGANTRCETYSDLAYYIKDLANNLHEAAETLLDMDADDEF